MLKKTLAIACLATLVSACGGGGGGGGGGGAGLFPFPTPAPAPGPGDSPASGPDTTPPSIVAFVPTASTDVPRNTEISATFSEALLASTVTNSNVRVTHAGTAVSGSLNYDAASHKVSFVPSRALDVLANYSVAVGTGLQDLVGNSLAAEKSWSFRTADGNWGAPAALVPATSVAIQPSSAQDGQGNTVVVWTQQAISGFYEIRAAMQRADDSWGSSSTLNTPGSYNAFLHRVAFDGHGQGLAIWLQEKGAGTELWSSRFIKDSGWQTPIKLDDVFNSGHAPSLAFDAQGNAFAAWVKVVAPNNNPDVFAARSTPAGGWDAPVRLGSLANIGVYDKAEQPQIAVDAAGSAYVLWVQRTSDAPVWAARYIAGSGWLPAVSLGAARLGDPYAPRIAVNGTGQVMALWNSFVPTGGGASYRFDLWWSTLAPGGSWTSPTLLENDDAGHAMNQALVADSAGNFHAIWQQFASEYSSDVVHRRYTPGSGWSTVTTVSTVSGTYVNNRSPSLVADRNGNLMALWGAYQSGLGTLQEGTFARRYATGDGWTSSFRVSTAGAEPALATSLDVHADGSISASWMEPRPGYSDGPILAARFK